ncbi:hypothetical protein [Leifsonia sp. NCR5]|uniref:hypothetical protein n=1 Tax=Leifsonia sp. NCR5 TaxID=1978342 RepID=UPI0015C4B57A|nr:hypothetical protein [Leifsonia sp. NCR5]
MQRYEAVVETAQQRRFVVEVEGDDPVTATARLRRAFGSDVVVLTLKASRRRV